MKESAVRRSCRQRWGIVKVPQVDVCMVQREQTLRPQRAAESLMRVRGGQGESGLRGVTSFCKTLHVFLCRPLSSRDPPEGQGLYPGPRGVTSGPGASGAPAGIQGSVCPDAPPADTTRGDPQISPPVQEDTLKVAPQYKRRRLKCWCLHRSSSFSRVLTLSENEVRLSLNLLLTFKVKDGTGESNDRLMGLVLIVRWIWLVLI
ncbi:hypothetical protein PBY51_018311 [Eleginops maclovinus]|uniref:Uncharacterized protein n=1 Tax=Eleginops maclovinus TaxID=56733 RepID=A0AAN8AUT6_ELEMC|nr:hypothetical protein PBY51_018311 [Eleginops maclovinus]